MCVCYCVCACAGLTSFAELGVEVGQAAGHRVGQPAAADPVAGLEAQVAVERALHTAERERGVRR